MLVDESLADLPLELRRKLRNHEQDIGQIWNAIDLPIFINKLPSELSGAIKRHVRRRFSYAPFDLQVAMEVERFGKEEQMNLAGAIHTREKYVPPSTTDEKWLKSVPVEQQDAV